MILKKRFAGVFQGECIRDFVFMLDRLCRRDEETPVVDERFVVNGIDTWSAVEGQQRFDDHVDKLLDYICYWQVSSESIKTSVRIKARMEQMTEKGLYTGCSVPYGYKLEKRGCQNKKNQDLNDLVVDEDAAKIVQLIFCKCVHEGLGAQQLGRYLIEMGIRKSSRKNSLKCYGFLCSKTAHTPACFAMVRPLLTLYPGIADYRPRDF